MNSILLAAVLLISLVIVVLGLGLGVKRANTTPKRTMRSFYKNQGMLTNRGKAIIG